VSNIRRAAAHPASDSIAGLHRAIGDTGMMAYLSYMAERLAEVKRVLRPHGSVYLHCDPHASHYLKVVMDDIFGTKMFKNEIVWCYRKMPNNAKYFQRNHDVILFYSASGNYNFNVLLGEATEGSKKTFQSAMRRGYNTNLSKKMVTVFDWNKYRNAVKLGSIPSDLKPKEFSGGRPKEKDWWEIKILGGRKTKNDLAIPHKSLKNF